MKTGCGYLEGEAKPSRIISTLEVLTVLLALIIKHEVLLPPPSTSPPPPQILSQCCPHGAFNNKDEDGCEMDTTKRQIIIPVVGAYLRASIAWY